ncbi:hypothetical protein [Thermococcus sp.]|uniref:hypothetical protein n=1 Tax=Thermococcus sp. TaxID=35749 RepID=UPI00261AD6ED|nr:hypothetical protein [Thermococcus sp.]
MYKKMISISLVTMAAMFAGCGNNDTTCRIDVQKAIDKGQYDDAIASMNGNCKNAFTKSDLNMNLAAAYMGKSGYSVSDITDMLVNSSTNGDAFSSFISDTNDKQKANALPFLSKAKDYYVQAIGGKESVCTDSNLSAINNSRWTNACLYIGFNKTVTTANTVSHLTNNVSAVVDAINSDSETPYDMNASMDALAWVTDKNFKPSDTTTITAKDVNIGGNAYANIIVKYSNTTPVKTFYRLAKSARRNTNNTTLITDGYCNASGDKIACAGLENNDGSINNITAGCYPCPIMLDANSSLSVSDSLVDALNNGTDTISAVSDDPDILQSITDFKQEIIGSRTNGDTNGTITVQDIINYLQQ